jgi:hypothetical protein
MNVFRLCMGLLDNTTGEQNRAYGNEGLKGEGKDVK